MDDRQFDRITRSLATGTSRRRVLGGLAGALAAALGGRRAALADHKPDHCAKAGQKAHPHKPCCSGLPGPDGRCGVGSTCPEGQACSGGLCCPTGFVACPGNPTGCIPASTACSGEPVCCSNNGAGPGIVCGFEGQCQAGSAPPPATCPAA